MAKPKEYEIKANSAVQLLSIGGIILQPGEEWKGSLEDEQLPEVKRAAEIGLITLEEVKAKKKAPPKKEEPSAEKFPESDEATTEEPPVKEEKKPKGKEKTK